MPALSPTFSSRMAQLAAACGRSLAAPAARSEAAAAAPSRPEGDRLTLSAAAGLARVGEVRLAPGTDALTITVRRGDTLWSLARRWGAEGATAGYVAAIRRANALEGDAIRIGQALRLPYDETTAGLNLLVALAVRKAHAMRGPCAPALDLRGLEVTPGPLDAYLVTAPREDGKGLQLFWVADDMSGEDPLKWTVEPLDKQAFDARARGEW